MKSFVLACCLLLPTLVHAQAPANITDKAFESIYKAEWDWRSQQAPSWDEDSDNRARKPSTTLADVGPALAAACTAQKEGRTTVLEMMVTRELGDPFRRDALSKPVRYLDKYRDYT